MRASRRRGFTLIEMMISVVLGSMIVLAAVAFASREVRTLARSNQVLEVAQVGRVVTDMISDDVTNAGVGVGYRSDGTFYGIRSGTFAMMGTTFDTTQRGITVDGVATTTDDLVLAMADGATASIVSAGRGSLVGQSITTCAPAPGEVNFIDGERVLARDAFGLTVASYFIVNVAPASPCPADVVCEASGVPARACQQILMTADTNQYTSDGGASTADYARGQLVGNFREVVWFVDFHGHGRLRRVVVDNVAPDCSTWECGAIVADGVESLQFRVREFSQAAGWADVTDVGVLDNLPIRVDFELAMRSRTEDATGQLHDAAQLLLESDAATQTCIPGPRCDGTRTLIRREVFRGSVEVKNSGYMQLNGGST